jgi:hypothetical protein
VIRQIGRDSRLEPIVETALHDALKRSETK